MNLIEWLSKQPTEGTISAPQTRAQFAALVEEIWAQAQTANDLYMDDLEMERWELLGHDFIYDWFFSYCV